jgi:hypothetical protein
MSNAIKRRIRNAEKAIEKKDPSMITTFVGLMMAAESPEGLEGKTLSPTLEEFVKNNTS